MRETETSDGVMSQQGAHLVLSTLAVNDGINQLELVKHTHLRPPTVSVILKRMESEGIVERKTNPDDKRSVTVHLTEFGKTLDKEHIKRIKEVDAVALSGLTDEELSTLMTLLPKIRDNLLPSYDKERKEDTE
ncbi:MAG: MarR family transcriptional regulator [Clostridia bacterium]|nr:MarR family transcriptional regulator [Clostridia bacterium]